MRLLSYPLQIPCFRLEGRALLIALSAAAILAGPAAAQETIYQPVNLGGFVPVELSGFGDSANTWVTSMEWFQGRLYVGTLRSAHCIFMATLVGRFGVGIYPPPGSDCSLDPRDLPLAAEIWRHTPKDGSWDLVYRSPRNVPIAFDPRTGAPTKLTARDIAYTSMVVHTEKDGKRVLYVGATSPVRVFAPIFEALGRSPAPRLLRSKDGLNFLPVPQKAGTVFGSLDRPRRGSALAPVSFGELLSLNGTLVALLRTEGGGTLLASGRPGAGNNDWVPLGPIPEELPVSAVAFFRNALYLAVASSGMERGYSIVKTTRWDGTRPFDVETVMSQPSEFGPHRVMRFSQHEGRLFAGTGFPTELVRIDKDGSWQMVMGPPPLGSPDFRFAPLSGIPSGFGNALTSEIAAMESYGGSLYVATMDASVLARFLPFLAPLLQHEFGFDLLRSEEGVYWYPVTRNGLSSVLQYSVASLKSTPLGLFVGTATGTDGAQVWTSGGGALAQADGPKAPYRLEAASALLTGGEVVLSWEPAADTVAYHVYRSKMRSLFGLMTGSGLSDLARERSLVDASGLLCDNLPNLCFLLTMIGTTVSIPGPFEWTAATTEPLYVEPQPTLLQSVYFVRAQRADGSLSDPSNIAGGASSAPPVRFSIVEGSLLQLIGSYQSFGPRRSPLRALFYVRTARNYANTGDIRHALNNLELAREALDPVPGTQLVKDNAYDVSLLIYRLKRNLLLADSSRISLSNLF